MSEILLIVLFVALLNACVTLVLAFGAARERRRTDQLEVRLRRLEDALWDARMSEKRKRDE